MRYKLFILLLLVSLSACSFQARALTPESLIPVTETESVTAVTTLPSLTETFTPSPASTDTNIPLTVTSIPNTVSSPIPQNPNVHPIHFAPNGTYVDIQDSLRAGESKTYSVDAMGGQVMSISVRQLTEDNWTTIPIKIVGADGTSLCPFYGNRECYFWRGVLPSTQNYFVTFLPEVDVNSIMIRVAVNPPGTATQSFLYESHDRTASLSYSDEFAPARFPEAHLQKIAPEFALQFINTKFYVNTNLSEAYLSFSTSSDPSIVASCTQTSANAENENIVGNVNINGISFTQSENNGVAAGNIYQQIFYRAAYQGECYEIMFFTHSGNIGNYPADSGIKEFEHVTLTQKFEAIFSTLVIK